MLPPITSLLLLVPLAAVAQSASSIDPLRGVPVSKRDLYNPTSDNFKCLDGSKFIPFSAVNDDYCDCKDGSDEPDKECCDGSDEYQGKIKCPNRCKELANVAQAKMDKVKKAAEKGYAVKLEYLKKAAVEKKEKADKEAALEAEIKALKERLEPLRAAKDAALAKEEALREKVQPESEIIIELQSELKLAYSWIASLTHAVYSLTPVKEECKGKAAKEVESLLVTLENVGKEKKELEDKKAASTKVTKEDVNKAMQETRKLEDEFYDVEAEISTKENQLNDMKDVVTVDTGPDGGMGILQTNCLTYDNPEYTYELCFFGRATQKAKSGGIDTNLGQVDWTGFSGKDLTKFSGKNLKYTEGKFENGSKCWNGPERSVTVTFECGEESKIISFTEPNKCEYAARVVTPGSCEPVESVGGNANVDEAKDGEKGAVVHDEL
ncbi:hypothetical protein HDV05_003348 [Chytridiales sp. JEL 0842]|nr:hypothetical protein HDV05_003348 [Chytridiales sp. JEL 0842]